MMEVSVAVLHLASGTDEADARREAMEDVAASVVDCY